MIADLSFSFIYLSAAGSIVVSSACRRVTRIRMITDALGGYCVQTYLRVLWSRIGMMSHSLSNNHAYLWMIFTANIIPTIYFAEHTRSILYPIADWFIHSKDDGIT